MIEYLARPHRIFGAVGILVVLMAAGALAAEDYVVRDRSGKVVERVEPLYPRSNTLVRRDNAGRRLGTIEINKDGSSVYRDKVGRREKTTERR